MFCVTDAGKLAPSWSARARRMKRVAQEVLVQKEVECRQCKHCYSRSQNKGMDSSISAVLETKFSVEEWTRPFLDVTLSFPFQTMCKRFGNPGIYLRGTRT